MLSRILILLTVEKSTFQPQCNAKQCTYNLHTCEQATLIWSPVYHRAWYMPGLLMLQNWLPGISLISISCGTEEKEISSPQMEDGLLSYWTSPDQLREFISSSSWRKWDLIKIFPEQWEFFQLLIVCPNQLHLVLKRCFGVWSSIQSRNSSILLCIRENIVWDSNYKLPSSPGKLRVFLTVLDEVSPPL